MTPQLFQGKQLNLNQFTYHQAGYRSYTLHATELEQPKHGDMVTVNYEAFLLNGFDTVGHKVDSSLDRKAPFRFGLGQGYVISGWDLAVATMKLNEEIIIILPPELAYGNQSIGSIPKNSFLIFYIKLLKIN